MMLHLPSLPLFHQPAHAGAGEKVGVGAPERIVDMQLWIVDMQIDC